MSRNLKIVGLFNKQDGRCYLCGGQMALKLGHENTATLDHVEPMCRARATEGPNTKAACDICNNEKAQFTEGEYRAVLAFRVLQCT